MGLAHEATCDLGYDCMCEPGKKLHDPEYVPQTEDELYGRWIQCDMCDEMWCMAHELHAFECACPSIDEVQGLEEPDDSDDSYALASAGFGTDEDYGFYGE